MRFAVMGDPQFAVRAGYHQPAGMLIPRHRHRKIKQYGNKDWRYVNPGGVYTPWINLGPCLRRVGSVDMLAICGDMWTLTGSESGRIGEHIAEYRRFVGRLAEFVPRVHNCWGGEEWQPGGQTHPVRDAILSEFPGTNHYVIRVGADAFVFFDNCSTYGELSHSDYTQWTATLHAWLTATLAALEADASVSRVWLISHVPPRNTGAWWWASGNGVTKSTARSGMADIIAAESTKVAGAFFGHEHAAGHLGDRGGFPMFVTDQQYPLIVDTGESNTFRWIKSQTAADPLSTAVDALTEVPAGTAKAMRWPAADAIPAAFWTAVGTETINSSEGDITFSDLALADGAYPMASVADVGANDKVLLVIPFAFDGANVMKYYRLRTDLGIDFKLNGGGGTATEEKQETIAAGTGGRWFGYSAYRATDDANYLRIAVSDVGNPAGGTIEFCKTSSPAQIT